MYFLHTQINFLTCLHMLVIAAVNFTVLGHGEGYSLSCLYRLYDKSGMSESSVINTSVKLFYIIIKVQTLSG
jgi:hypothetical protein